MPKENNYYIKPKEIPVIRNTLLHVISDLSIDPVSVGVAMAYIEERALRGIPVHVYLSDEALNKIYATVIGEPLKPLKAFDIRRTKGVLAHFSTNPEVDDEAIINALSKIQKDLRTSNTQPKHPSNMRPRRNRQGNILHTIRNIVRSPNVARS